MGAYLSEPVTEKHSSDESRSGMSYGASSMQGWRVSQEDAHNSILDYDTDTHLFAVYDGHGGHEVSAYTALKLPEFLKETTAYKEGDLSQALINSFLEFDATLVKPEVVAALTQIAGSKETAEDSEESDGEDVDDLYREATMPLAEVIAKYAENPQTARCKKEKVASPFLKSKGSAITSDNSSSNGNSSGSDDGDTDVAARVDDGEPEEDKMENAATSSSSSSLTETTEDKPKVEINGEDSKHMVNGGETKDGEKAEKGEIKGGKAEDTETKVEKTETREEEEAKDVKDTSEKKENVENEDPMVNGEQPQPQTPQETGKGKGKGGKGGKGKALLKNSEVVAMREARAKERRREAAVRAAEIYRKMQEGAAEEDLSEEEEEEEEEEDETFEEGGEEDEAEEDADAEESEDEEEDDDEDEDVETEEDEDDPYAQFALNMKEEPGFDSGCTACVAILRGTELYVANVGDSRCVVSRDGVAADMSLDHKPEDDREAARIIKAGGRVTADGRVNGGLNLSRAIGDHGYKQNKALSAEEQMISPLPDVQTMTLGSKDKFMIVACDGIWNSLSSQEACDFVSERLDRLSDDGKLSDICEELFDHCLAPDTHGDGTGCDNMTCIIIRFKDLSCGSAKRTLGEVQEAGDPQQEEKKLKVAE